MQRINERILVGNAPVSFGIFEPGFGATKQMPYAQVLDMIAKAGYEGTELGPYGYLPTDPKALATELQKYHLKLGSSFVPLKLADVDAATKGKDEALTVARLLATQDVSEVIIADAGDERRIQAAGMHPTGWSADQHKRAADNLMTIARALKSELGMHVVVHHHVGTYYETPEEINQLLTLTDPELVGLLLDTGHYVYGGGDPVALVNAQRARINYVHYKDIDATKLERVRREKIDMQTAWRQGVFVPLGQGCIDFAAITDILKSTNYSGWIIVEQDSVADDTGKLTPDPFESAKASRQYLKNLGL